MFHVPNSCSIPKIINTFQISFYTGISKFHFQFSGKFCTLNVSVKYSAMKPSLENELQKIFLAYIYK